MFGLFFQLRAKDCQQSVTFCSVFAKLQLPFFFLLCFPLLTVPLVLQYFR
ncbi:hypothetical protein SUBVAR_04654 [Subdoligranulum variabile DSM 15176]|uniref:Uncharacterized protein n=1 Tax=Subdoligranulum variabile DSM 15176 TaxID=411471 RepID=D1PJT4_9FIRM|nr:hypothetical protein SUBVAR_04654 [Subdoligranulum variabile DSM 15176]